MKNSLGDQKKIKKFKDPECHKNEVQVYVHKKLSPQVQELCQSEQYE